jgi:hypothetical protein
MSKSTCYFLANPFKNPSLKPFSFGIVCDLKYKYRFFDGSCGYLDLSLFLRTPLPGRVYYHVVIMSCQ